jgi:hypothetical protein
MPERRRTAAGEVATMAKPNRGKKYFTVTEANAALPLVRAVVRDITELARGLRERHERLTRVRPPERGHLGAAYQEELEQMRAEFERDQERLEEYAQELRQLGVELKDMDVGLIDFPCQMHGREVYLCWRLGEDEVGYWHELEAGYAGRQKILADAAHG